jgi:hypothetical protein
MQTHKNKFLFFIISPPEKFDKGKAFLVILILLTSLPSPLGKNIFEGTGKQPKGESTLLS